MARAFQRQRLSRRVLAEDLLKELHDADDPDAVTAMTDLKVWLRSRSTSRQPIRQMERAGLVILDSQGDTAVNRRS